MPNRQKRAFFTNFILARASTQTAEIKEPGQFAIEAAQHWNGMMAALEEDWSEEGDEPEGGLMMNG